MKMTWKRKDLPKVLKLGIVIKLLHLRQDETSSFIAKKASFEQDE